MRESFDDFPTVAPPAPPLPAPVSAAPIPTGPAMPVAANNPVPAAPESFDDFPALNTAPTAAATPPAEPPIPGADLPDSERYAIMGGGAVTKGLTSIATGIPDLLHLAYKFPANEFQGKPALDGTFPLTNAAFSAENAAGKAMGVPDVEPKNWKEKLGQNIALFGSGALSPGGLVAEGAEKVAPLLANVAPETAAKLATPLESYPRLFTDARVQQAANARAVENPSLFGAIKDVSTPTAAKLASGAGAGLGATAAEEVAPDSPTAALIASFLGGAGGPAAAKMGTGLITAPGATLARTLRGVTLEPAFDNGLLNLPHTAANVDKAAEIFQNMATDKDQAAANIENNAADFAGDAVQQTPANLSQDSGLIRLEKGARLADQKTGNRFINNDQALQEQNLNDFEKLAPSETGNKQATVDTIAAQTQAVKDAAAGDVANEQANATQTQQQAQLALSDADKERLLSQSSAAGDVDAAKAAADKVASDNATTAEQISATPRMPREEAGNSLVNDVLTPAKQAQRDQYSAMIAPFENDNTPSLDTSMVQDDLAPLERYQQVFGEGSQYKGLIDHVLAMKPRAAEDGAVVLPQTSPAEMLRTEQNLNAAMRQAKANNDGNAMQALGVAKDAVGKVLDNSNLGTDFANARNFYRENIAEPFNQGVSKQVLSAGTSGEDFAKSPAESIGKFFQPGAKGGQSMDQLISAADKLPKEPVETPAIAGPNTAKNVAPAPSVPTGKDTVLPYIQSHVSENMVDKFYNPTTQKFNTAQMRKYLNDHREALSRVPEVKDDWNRIINQLDNGKDLHDVALQKVMDAKEQARQVKIQSEGKYADVKNQANQSLVQAKQRVAEVQAASDAKVTAEQKSAARFYLNDPDPDKAIARALSSSNNPAKDLSELKRRTDLDPTGKATLGLKEAIYDNLQAKIQKASKTLESGRSPITPSDMEMLKNNRDALVKSGIFSAGDKQILDTLQKRIETAQRGVDLKVTAGSATAENSALSDTQKAIARSTLRTVFGGFEGGNKYSILKDAVSLITGADQKARAINDILQRSLLDPQLAVLLLKRDLSKSEQSLFYTKINRVLTNRTALAVTGSQEQKQ